MWRSTRKRDFSKRLTSNFRYILYLKCSVSYRTSHMLLTWILAFYIFKIVISKSINKLSSSFHSLLISVNVTISICVLELRSSYNDTEQHVKENTSILKPEFCPFDYMKYLWHTEAALKKCGSSFLFSNSSLKSLIHHEMKFL